MHGTLYANAQGRLVKQTTTTAVMTILGQAQSASLSQLAGTLSSQYANVHRHVVEPTLNSIGAKQGLSPIKEALSSNYVFLRAEQQSHFVCKFGVAGRRKVL